MATVTTLRNRGLTAEQIADLKIGQKLILKYGKNEHYLRAKVEVLSIVSWGCRVRILQVLEHGGQNESRTNNELDAAFSMLETIKV